MAHSARGSARAQIFFIGVYSPELEDGFCTMNEKIRSKIDNYILIWNLTILQKIVNFHQLKIFFFNLNNDSLEKSIMFNIPRFMQSKGYIRLIQKLSQIFITTILACAVGART